MFPSHSVPCYSRKNCVSTRLVNSSEMSFGATLSWHQSPCVPWHSGCAAAWLSVLLFCSHLSSSPSDPLVWPVCAQTILEWYLNTSPPIPCQTLHLCIVPSCLPFLSFPPCSISIYENPFLSEKGSPASVLPLPAPGPLGWSRADAFESL